MGRPRPRRPGRARPAGVEGAEERAGRSGVVDDRAQKGQAGHGQACPHHPERQLEPVELLEAQGQQQSHPQEHDRGEAVGEKVVEKGQFLEQPVGQAQEGHEVPAPVHVQGGAHRQQAGAHDDGQCHPRDPAPAGQEHGDADKDQQRDAYVGALLGAIAGEVLAHLKHRGGSQAGDVGGDDKVQQVAHVGVGRVHVLDAVGPRYWKARKGAASTMNRPPATFKPLQA